MSKTKQKGCRCRRRSRQCGPKVIHSMCHGNCDTGGYHPSVRERIDGKRAVYAWERAEELDDIEV